MPTATAKKVDLNTWYQIHTNGGITTFARIYLGHDDNGYGCFVFEKMTVDTTVPQGEQTLTEIVTAKVITQMQGRILTGLFKALRRF